MKKSTMQPGLLPPLLFVLIGLAAGPVYADCTNPAGKEADLLYNGNYSSYQFCNGTKWLAFGGGLNCSGSGGYSPTTPARNGYFVLSKGTWDGLLGGSGTLAGADSLCLTDLTTNTGWKGYSTANANGQLISAKVHALLCAGSGFGSCNNLMPLATYIFANANDASAGGASFTTDSVNGFGPNDSANWGAANYFSGTYFYWTNMDSRNTTNTAWDGGSNAFQSGGLGGCETVSEGTMWVTNSSSYIGTVGISTNTGASRWTFVYITCDKAIHLICYVDP